MARPDGYLYHRDELMGTLALQKGEPGLGCVQVAWNPSPNIEHSKKILTFISQECFDRIVDQEIKDRERRSALEASAKKAIKA